VDDDAAVRTSLARLLGVEGYQVWTCASATDLLARALPASPLCVLVDVRMPGLGGFELMEILLADTRRAPTILMSADADASLRERAMRDGASDFLEKPFDGQRLLDVVQRALATDGRRGGAGESLYETG
jgi:FixJ family two-component response regulator